MEQTLIPANGKVEQLLHRAHDGSPSAKGLGVLAPHPVPVDLEADHLALEGIPLLARELSETRSGGVFEGDGNGLAAEQFRLMQRRLTNVRPTGGAVLVTSPGAGDGKSLNAHNLAWALAEAGNCTLLLELDLRRPTQARYFRAQTSTHNNPSITDVLTGELAPSAAVRRIDGLPLCFLGLHKAVENPTALLRSGMLQQLLGWSRRRFAWVVMDAPPILPVADVEELLPSADLVLLVVRERATPRAMTVRAAERLGKRLNYVIFNDVELSTAYGYGYQYK